MNNYKGKSLSLICGSLTWLRDHKRRKLNDELEQEVDGMLLTVAPPTIAFDY